MGGRADATPTAGPTTVAIRRGGSVGPALKSSYARGVIAA